jgi:predicted Zn-dependent peptidase
VSRVTPPATLRRLSNGLTVLVLHTPTDPVSAAHLFIPVGASNENPALGGVSSLGCAVLSKGTHRKNARQLAEEIESVGGSISAGVTHDYVEMSCHAIADYFPRTFTLFAETLLSPAFAEDEVAKERTALLAAIRSKRESIFTLANEELNRRLYGTHAYARPATGTEKTVKPLRSAQLRAWHSSVVAPSGAVLSIATSRPAAEVFRLVDELLGPAAWRKGTPRGRAVGRTPQHSRAQAVTLREPFEQAYLVVGYPAPPVGSPIYFSLKALNAVLGGGMSARLFQRLREQQGLAYDVGTFYPSKRRGSAFVAYMGLQEENLERAREGMLASFEELHSAPMPEKELEEIKSYLKGTFVLDHQTNSQRAHYVGWWEVLGMGREFDARYLKHLAAVRPKDVLRAAKQIFGQPPIVIEIRPKKKPAKATAR